MASQDRESEDLTLQEITSVSSLNDFLAAFQDENVNNCIESITYNAQSQTMIIKMQELVEEATRKLETRKLEPRITRTDDWAERIRKLSESYREKFPQLLHRFNAWRPARQRLIETLRSSPDHLDRNSAIVDSVRIVTSTADIVGTLARIAGKSDDSWAGFAMEHASAFGLFSLFIEMTVSGSMLRGVKKAIKQDQKLFEEIVEWFKQTEELDSVVRNFFPYGIDTELTKKIANSPSDLEDCHKIFMSIVASNVKKDVKLFKNERFLDKADRFANSEAGKQWFYNLTLKDDPVFRHTVNCRLNEEIRDILKNSAGTNNPALYMDGFGVMLSRVKVKTVLNLMTIVSAVGNLWSDSKREDSDAMRELSEKVEAELRAIKKVVRLLTPSDFKTDDVLL